MYEQWNPASLDGADETGGGGEEAANRDLSWSPPFASNRPAILL